MIMSEAAATRLLDTLCTEFGYCLSPDSRRAIRERAPGDPQAFVDSVVVAEGLDPAALGSSAYRQLLTVAQSAFDDELRAQQDALAPEPSGVLFEVWHVPRQRPRYLLCRQLDSANFDVEASALNGHPVQPTLSQPRAMYADGTPRFDIFAFHLRDWADIKLFKLGQLALLTRVPSEVRGAG